MSVQNVLTTLTNHVGLAGLVASRIYRGRLPQNPEYPLILFRYSEDPENTTGGASSLKHYTYEFECYGADYQILENIKTELIDALASTSDFSSVCSGVADDDYQSDNGNYSIFLDFSLWF